MRTGSCEASASALPQSCSFRLSAAGNQSGAASSNRATCHHPSGALVRDWCRSPRTRVQDFRRVGYGAAHGFGPHPPCGAAARFPSAQPPGDREAARAPPAARAARCALPACSSPFGGPAPDPASDRVRHVERGAGGDEAARDAGGASRRRAAAADRRDGGRAAPAAARLPERRDRDRLPPRRRRLAPARPDRAPGERRPLRAALAQARRHERDEPRLVPAARRPRPRHVGALGRRRSRHRRLLPGRRHRGRDHGLRALEPDARRADRRPPAARSVRRRLADAPARRPRVDGRLERREGADEGRHDRRRHRRRAPGARPVHAGRGQQRLAVGAPGGPAVGSLEFLAVAVRAGGRGRRTAVRRAGGPSRSACRS